MKQELATQTAVAAQEQKFWARVNKDGPLPDQSNPHYAGLGACWTWTGTRMQSGHGYLYAVGRAIYAHRISWSLAFYPVADSQCVLHKCDNPSCVNPRHLFLGSRADNNRDRARKGRTKSASGDSNWTRRHPERVLRGEAHGMTKITAQAVAKIRELASGGLSQRALAARFGVGRSHIYRLIHLKSWAHL